MAQYIIHFPRGVDYLLLRQLGVRVQDSVCCVGCVVAELQDWQIADLEDKGCTVTLDDVCGIC